MLSMLWKGNGTPAKYVMIFAFSEGFRKEIYYVLMDIGERSEPKSGPGSDRTEGG